jgi:hypothetical protein
MNAATPLLPASVPIEILGADQSSTDIDESWTPPQLKRWDLSNRQLGEKDLDRLCRHLREQFEFAAHNFIVRGRFIQVSELSLAGNHLTDASCTTLVAVLNHELCSVRVLNLSNNDIGPAGVQALVNFLQDRSIAEFVGPRLSVLDLSKNPIGTDGEQLISDLKGKEKMLRVLTDAKPSSGNILYRLIDLVRGNL